MSNEPRARVKNFVAADRHRGDVREGVARARNDLYRTTGGFHGRVTWSRIWPARGGATIASTSGTDSATTIPMRQPSDRKLRTSHDDKRFGIWAWRAD